MRALNNKASSEEVFPFLLGQQESRCWAALGICSVCAVLHQELSSSGGWGAVPTGGHCHVHSGVCVDYSPSLWFYYCSPGLVLNE